MYHLFTCYNHGHFLWWTFVGEQKVCKMAIFNAYLINIRLTYSTFGIHKRKKTKICKRYYISLFQSRILRRCFLEGNNILPLLWIKTIWCISALSVSTTFVSRNDAHNLVLMAHNLKNFMRHYQSWGLESVTWDLSSSQWSSHLDCNGSRVPESHSTSV